MEEVQEVFEVSKRNRWAWAGWLDWPRLGTLVVCCVLPGSLTLLGPDLSVAFPSVPHLPARAFPPCCRVSPPSWPATALSAANLCKSLDEVASGAFNQ